MFYVHTKDLVTDDPFPMYQTYSELIEADGEAEKIFLDEVVNNGYAERYFNVTDDVSEDMIELDITFYIGDKAWTAFEKTINNYTEDEGDLTYTKANSWFIACGKAKR